jgi:hypothetical protein
MKKGNLTKYLRVRFTETEYNKLQRMVKQNELGTVSNFVRQYLFSDNKVLIDPKTFLKGVDALTASVNKVGNNINQIAKFLNTTKDVNNYALMREWFDLFAQYNDVLREINRKIEELFMCK